jgi:hypothetical protein
MIHISPFTTLSKGSGHGKVSLPGADRTSLDTHLYLAFDPSTPMAPIVTGSGIDAGEYGQKRRVTRGLQG